MAHAGQVIENPATGERITFLRTAADTGGELLELDDVWTRPGHRAAPHLHPGMEERFEILEGTARFVVDGVEIEAGPGDVWEEFVERLFADPDGGAALLPDFRAEVRPIRAE